MDQNTTICVSYVTAGLLFDECAVGEYEKWSIIVAGLAAVVVLPVSTFGLLGNIVLIFRLLTKVNVPPQLNLWGAVCCIIDSLFILVCCFLLSVPHVLQVWWGVAHVPLSVQSYILCGVLRGIRDFILGIRSNFNFCLLWHMSTFSVANVFDAGISKVGLCIFIVLCMTVMQASPALITHGVWQYDGAFLCAPDPLWSHTYHQYYWLHILCFIDGLVPSICMAALWMVLYRRRKAERILLDRLKGFRNTQYLFGRIKSAKELELCHVMESGGVVLTHTLVQYGCRLGSCAYKIFLYLWHGVHTKLRNESITKSNLASWLYSIELPMYFELISTGFSFIWWITNLNIKTAQKVDKLQNTCCQSTKVRSCRNPSESTELKDGATQDQLSKRMRILKDLEDLKNRLYDKYAYT